MRPAHRFLVIGIAATCVAIYLYTAAPFMLWQDASRYLAAIITLGISYPPEPVYVFLAHWFTYLPFGSVIFRIQVFSALLAGGSLLLLYRLVIHISGKTSSHSKKSPIALKQPPLLLAGIFSLLALAFSYQFWSQTQNVETFILDCFIELVILNLLLSEITHKTVFTILAFVVVICGIATGTDPPVIVAVFPSVLLVVWKWRTSLKSKQLAALFLLGIAAVILAWLYLPIAETRNPLLNDFNGLTFQSLWDVAHRQNAYAPSKGLTNGLTWSPSVMLTSAWHYLVMAWQDFTPVLLPFIAAGGVYLWRKNRYTFFLLFLVTITNFISSCLNYSFNQESWFLQSDVVFAIFAAFGFLWITETLATRITILKFRVIQITLFLLAFIPLVYWWSMLDRHSWNLTQDYIDNLYRPVQSPAILIGTGDLFEATSAYVYTATNYRHDVVPLWNLGLYMAAWKTVNLASRAHLNVPDTSHLAHNSVAEYSKFMNDFFADNIGKYHIYLTRGGLRDDIFVNGPFEQSLVLDTSRFKLIPVGMLQEVVPTSNHVPFDAKSFVYHFGNGFPHVRPHIIERNYNDEMQELISEIAYSYDSAANYLMHEKQNDEADTFIQKAYTLLPDNVEIIGDLGVFYGRQHQYTLALTYFTKAHALQPTIPIWLYDMAIVEGQLGKIDEEKRDLQSIIDNPQADEAYKKFLTAKLDSLNQHTGSFEADIKPEARPVPLGWKQITNAAMNLTFIYPQTLRVNQIKPQIISLSDPTQTNFENELLIYSGELPSDNSKNLWVPFHLFGQLQKYQPVQIPGFQAVLYTYADRTIQTQLLVLKRGQQLIALYYPEQLKVNQEVLNQIVQSIATVH